MSSPTHDDLEGRALPQPATRLSLYGERKPGIWQTCGQAVRGAILWLLAGVFAAALVLGGGAAGAGLLSWMASWSLWLSVPAGLALVVGIVVWAARGVDR